MPVSADLADAFAGVSSGISEAASTGVCHLCRRLPPLLAALSGSFTLPLLASPTSTSVSSNINALVNEFESISADSANLCSLMPMSFYVRAQNFADICAGICIGIAARTFGASLY